MNYVCAFLAGGTLCAAGQLVMSLTRPSVTTGHILAGYVTAGTLISASGLYQPLVNFAGAGALVPLSGFGHSLAQGVLEAVDERGLLGIFSGGLEATAGGVTAAVVFGCAVALLFNPKG
jgi:stage V sporulation protein AE